VTKNPQNIDFIDCTQYLAKKMLATLFAPRFRRAPTNMVKGKVQNQKFNVGVTKTGTLHNVPIVFCH